MKNIDFPKGPTPPPLVFSHFPSAQQAFIWRNWEMFSAEKLAAVLGTGAANVLKMAADMGLRVPPVVNEAWKRKGYITIIRANWHLLTYEQILRLLGWTEEKLVYTLKEDDFLFAKLGSLKPDCKPLKYEPLTDEQKQQTRKMAALVKKHFSTAGRTGEEPSFAFINYKDSAEKNTPARKTAAADEALINESWGIILPKICKTDRLSLYAGDFIQAHKSKWGHLLALNSKKPKTITLTILPDNKLSPESHTVIVNHDAIEITSVDEFGIYRALQWMENKMDEQGGPFLPLGKFCMETRFESRIIYPYHSHYSDPFISDPDETCPDSLLKELSRSGINGIWFQGILYTLIPWKRDPSLSKGWQKRIESLKNLAERAARYGIGVYLYLGEPRCLPKSFFEKNPELKGIEPPYIYGNVATLCVSTKPVKEFLKDSLTELFTKVPELAGVFTITASENPANCHSKYNGASCPRCGKRTPQDVIAEVNSLIEAGVHRAKPSAKVMAWTWGWRTDWEGIQISLKDWAPGIIEKLPKNIELLATSEEAMPLCIGSISSYSKDYSISNPGPSERSLRLWEMAKKRGLKTAAKVQLNNSWENAAVPYIPALNMVDAHLQNLIGTNVKSLVVSWTLGGCPNTPNLLRMRDYIWKTTTPRSLGDFATSLYGEKASKRVFMAWKIMSDAFKHLPHNIPVLYFSPLHMGPANLLFVNDSGYKSTMVMFPYDDLSRWCGIYPEHVFIEQFKKLSEEWRKGVELLEETGRPTYKKHQAALEDLIEISRANYCHFRTTYLQAYFISQRNALYYHMSRYGIMESGEERVEILKRILKILAEEIEIAKMLYPMARGDSRLGFEATQHYYYRTQDLIEKVLNCQSLIEYFQKLLDESRHC